MACIDDTFGRAGLEFVKTTCFSVRAIGMEFVDNGSDLLLLVGDEGVCGIDSSVKKFFPGFAALSFV